MDAINIWVYNYLHKKRRRVTLRVSSDKRDRRKTEISTFVNFIHQKDAQIAMSVVDKMLDKGFPIYTVYDNFITTAECSQHVPCIYRNVIKEMGPPLSIINEFIYMNVIEPIVVEMGFGPEEGDFSEKLIPEILLHSYLKANVPKSITKNKNKMATWNQKITVILNSYENYTRIVCGDSLSNKSDDDLWNAHKIKWEEFKSKLNGEYCVHN